MALFDDCMRFNIEAKVPKGINIGNTNCHHIKARALPKIKLIIKLEGYSTAYATRNANSYINLIQYETIVGYNEKIPIWGNTTNINHMLYHVLRYNRVTKYPDNIYHNVTDDTYHFNDKIYELLVVRELPEILLEGYIYKYESYYYINNKNNKFYDSSNILYGGEQFVQPQYLAPYINFVLVYRNENTGEYTTPGIVVENLDDNTIVRFKTSEDYKAAGTLIAIMNGNEYNPLYKFTNIPESEITDKQHQYVYITKEIKDDGLEHYKQYYYPKGYDPDNPVPANYKKDPDIDYTIHDVKRLDNNKEPLLWQNNEITTDPCYILDNMTSQFDHDYQLTGLTWAPLTSIEIENFDITSNIILTQAGDKGQPYYKSLNINIDPSMPFINDILNGLPYTYIWSQHNNLLYSVKYNNHIIAQNSILDDVENMPIGTTFKWNIDQEYMDLYYKDIFKMEVIGPAPDVDHIFDPDFPDELESEIIYIYQPTGEQLLTENDIIERSELIEGEMYWIENTNWLSDYIREYVVIEGGIDIYDTAGNLRASFDHISIPYNPLIKSHYWLFYTDPISEDEDYVPDELQITVEDDVLTIEIDDRRLAYNCWYIGRVRWWKSKIAAYKKNPDEIELPDQVSYNIYDINSNEYNIKDKSTKVTIDLYE